MQTKCRSSFKRHRYSTAAFSIVMAMLVQLPWSDTHGQSKTGSQSDNRQPQKYEQQGVAVEFTIEPVTAAKERASELLAGTEATVRFKITDANSGNTLNSLRPAVWIDQREAGAESNPRACREKIQSFLQPGFNRRPSIDLNAYFILTLNNEPNISVIDPLSGFGGSKLFTLVALPGAGEDWVMSGDRKRLYVSMPALNQVAAVDLATWKVIASIDAGVNPSRIVLQNDGKYLWIGNDSVKETDSGVTVIDTETLKVAAKIKTGLGHHEIAFTLDDRSAFITNKQSGTLSSVDVRRLALVKEIKVGSLPASLVFSPLSQEVYVANEGDGNVVAVDGTRLETRAQIKTAPGSSKLRVPPDGRFGFAVCQATNSVYIFDLATHQLVQTVPVGPKPDQIAFTQQFAYVRAASSEFVSMINLDGLGKGEAQVGVSRFPAGQRAPQESPATSLAPAMVPAPDPGAMLVANPADKMIYFYMEGMAAPMGSFQNYSRIPKAILVLNNSLRETKPGVYSTNVRLTEAGIYDVAFLLDNPRLVNCFSLTIAENPALTKEPEIPIKVTVLPSTAAMRAGTQYTVRFKVTDVHSNQPKSDLKDMGVLVFLAPGIWQQRDWAKPLGDGVYEMSFVPPEAGVYYFFFQCPSLSVKFSQMPAITLNAVKAAEP